MFVDIIGILLTIIIVSPRYWIIVLLLCCIELISTIFISMTLESNITEVIAGGIFTSIMGADKINIFSPLLLLLMGFGLSSDRKLLWQEIVNPLAYLKRPWPILMIKTAIFRMTIILFFSGN